MGGCDQRGSSLRPALGLWLKSPTVPPVLTERFQMAFTLAFAVHRVQARNRSQIVYLAHLWDHTAHRRPRARWAQEGAAVHSRRVDRCPPSVPAINLFGAVCLLLLTLATCGVGTGPA